MPPVNGLNTLVKADAINSDIISAIHNAYPTAVKQSKGIAKSFVGSNRLQTSFNIWKWLKSNIHYVKDIKGSQWVKLPNRFISDGSGDCKSYSLFTAGILGALGIPFSFRYTSYIPGSSIPTHIYVVTQDENGTPIIIDGVYKSFNSQKAFEFKKDYPMNVSVLSGFDDYQINGISDDDYIGAVLDTSTPAEIAAAYRAITCINNRSGVYGPGDVEDIGALKDVVKKVAKKVAAPVKKVSQAVAKKVVTAVKKVAEAGTKVTLAPARGAYLLLLRINVHGFAGKVLQKKNDSALKNRWENLGGDFKELIKNAEVGAKKKSIFGVGDPATITALASASAIIAALAPILGKGEKVPATAAPDSASGSKVAALIQKATPFIKAGSLLKGKVGTKVETLTKKAQAAKSSLPVVAPVPSKGGVFNKAKAAVTAAKSASNITTASGGSSYSPTSYSSGGSSAGSQSETFETDIQPSETGSSSNMLLLVGLGIGLLALTSK